MRNSRSSEAVKVVTVLPVIAKTITDPWQRSMIALITFIVTLATVPSRVLFQPTCNLKSASFEQRPLFAVF